MKKQPTEWKKIIANNATKLKLQNAKAVCSSETTKTNNPVKKWAAAAAAARE